MDPWGSEIDSSSEHDAGFEDSFLPQQEGIYVPLDDSQQYLAGLERRLARVQGRSRNHRQAESRRLIDALAASRSVHAHQLIENTEVSENVHLPTDNEHTNHSSATVDPQGALGSMLRRVAPDRVALSHEELCRLLEADILSKVHDALEEEEDSINTRENSTDRVHNDSENSKIEECIKTEDRVKASNTQSAVTSKEHSSDEGEK